MRWRDSQLRYHGDLRLNRRHLPLTSTVSQVTQNRDCYANWYASRIYWLQSISHGERHVSVRPRSPPVASRNFCRTDGSYHKLLTEAHNVDRALAAEITSHLLELDEPLNAALAAVEKLRDGEQKRAFRRAIAGVTAAIYTDLLVPIGREFPDLLPDKDDLDRT